MTCSQIRGGLVMTWKKENIFYQILIPRDEIIYYTWASKYFTRFHSVTSFGQQQKIIISFSIME